MLFSHYLYAVPLRSKRGDEVDTVLESIFEQDSYRKIQTDRGSEFVNPRVRKIPLKYNAVLYHSHSAIKVVLAERFIKTVRF